jgi:CTP synthase (UTP-ammonia lyase)
VARLVAGTERERRYRTGTERDRRADVDDVVRADVDDVVRVAVVGDYRDDNETHRATGAAVDHAAEARGWAAEVTWIATPDVEGAAARTLARFHALWIAPGSPYQSMQGALDAITYARTNDVPLLGTCGGFQHVAIEFARNVLGITDAEHAEHDPTAPRLLVDALACSLVGRTMDVTLVEGSVARRAYGASGTTERYYCRFGLNPAYVEALTRGGLVTSGTDQDGEARVVELSDRRFFVATLFVPQTSSAPGAAHPLVSAYLAAARQPTATPA